MFELFKKLSPRYWRELGRMFRNHKWERNDTGEILIGTFALGGVFETVAPDGLGAVATHNLITTEGANHVLSVAIAGGTQYTTWYVAPFSGNVAVADTMTAAAFATTYSELTNTHYSETTRVAFQESTPATKSTNNTSNPATFTAATDNVTVWGAVLMSSSAKSATTGVLLSAVKYTTARVLPTTGDTLGIKYTLTLANSA